MYRLRGLSFTSSLFFGYIYYLISLSLFYLCHPLFILLKSSEWGSRVSFLYPCFSLTYGSRVSYHMFLVSTGCWTQDYRRLLFRVQGHTLGRNGVWIAKVKEETSTLVGWRRWRRWSVVVDVLVDQLRQSRLLESLHAFRVCPTDVRLDSSRLDSIKTLVELTNRRWR